MSVRSTLATFRGSRVPHLEIIKHRNWWFTLSGVFVVLSLVGLFAVGLKFSIDFTGGALLSFTNESGATVQDYQTALSKFGLKESTVEFVNGNVVQIKTESLTSTPTATPTTPAPSATTPASPSPSATVSPTPTATTAPTPTASGASASPVATASNPVLTTPQPSQNLVGDQVRTELARVAGISPDQINEQDVGPTWGSTISKKALQGLFIFLILVSAYISFRFEWKMAIAALVALAHDLIITAGIYALVGREVTPASVIAILTILGYSLYDTVVIFDKVKENTDQAALVQRETYAGVVNLSLNTTLMRSVNTSLVVLLPIGSLLFFGGQTLKDFAFALFIGVVAGTYSSIFLASPLLVVLKEREPRYQQIKTRAATRAARPAPVPQTKGRVTLAPAPAPADGDMPDAAAASPAATGNGAGTPRSQPSQQGNRSQGSGGGGSAKKRSKPKAKRRRR